MIFPRDWEETAFGDDEEYSQDSIIGGGDMPYVNPELSGAYHYNFEDIAHQQGVAATDNRIGPDGNSQSRSATLITGTQRGMQPGSPSTNPGVIPGSGISHADFGQMPLTFSAQLHQPSVAPMLQNRPGQMFQHNMGQMTQAVMGQINRTVPGQMVQTMPGQMTQPAAGHLAQALLEQMVQAMPGDMTHINPRQAFKPGPGQIGQPGNRQVLGSGPSGHMQGHPQRGGGTSYQRLRGTMRGRGKARGAMSSSGTW